MKADTTTLEKLFGAPIRYLIPLYQRPYVWNQNKQWEPLWSDLRDLAERWLDNAAVEGVDADGETQPHFLGAVVLEQLSNATGTLELRNVIDGQQRLTTLQIALDAIESVVAEHGDTDDVDLLRDLILNTKKVKNDGEQFKVWPTNVDRAAFIAAMDDDGDRVSHADSNLVQCHDYFRGAALDWALQNGPAEAGARLHGLTVAMLGRVQLVVIDLERGDNPQVIFETLNDRGEPLLAGDLIKNEMLHRVMRDSGEAAMDRCYEDFWKPFDLDAFWREVVRQGRFKRPRLDILLFHWLTVRTRRLASVGQEFLTFRRYVESSALPITEVVEDLAQTAAIWRQLEEEPRTTPLGASLHRLNVLDAGTLRPLILSLFNEPELSEDDRLTAVRMVESWAVRRAVCKFKSSGTNRFVVDLLGRLDKSDGRPIVDELRDVLASQTSETSQWPTDTQFFEALTVLPLYNRISQARVRLILEALEGSLRSRKTEEDVPEGLSIEHLLPRGWTHDAWPLPDTDPTGATRAQMIDTLGNLTLLTSSLNASQSNSSWASKRVGLKQSVLRLNREFDDCDAWTEDMAAARGRRLAEKVLEIWPRPTTVPAAVAAPESVTSTSVAQDGEHPDRQPTPSELRRSAEVVADPVWPEIASLVRSWVEAAFDDAALARAGVDWGVTAAPGGDRVVAVHVGNREALTVRADGSVDLFAASALPNASDSITDLDEANDTSNHFDSIEAADNALQSEDVRSEILTWVNGLPGEVLPVGYSNPALVDALRAGTESQPTREGVKELRFEFWSGLESAMRNSYPGIGIPPPTSMRLWRFPTIRPGLHYFMCFYGRKKTKRFGIFLSIDDARGAKAEQMYHYLLERRAQVEDSMGTALYWSEEPDRAWRLVIIEYPPDVVYEDRHTWPELQAWAVEHFGRMYDAFAPAIAAMPKRND